MTKVIYEDNKLIAVDKPPGIVVYNQKHSTMQEKCLSSLLVEKFSYLKGVGGERNGAVHRLDKDTSGVVLFAKDEKSLSYFQSQLLEKKVKKRYITLVFKPLKKDSGEIRTFIERSPKDRRRQRAYLAETGKREAVSFFKVLKRFQNYTLLEVEIETGRKHQIRCHLSFIGHPVVGDNLYKFKDQISPPTAKRQMLHAELIGIEDKIFKSPLPNDFKSVIDYISQNNY